LYPRLFQFGHFAIPTYGALTALALVAGLALLVNSARRLSLNANKLWNLGLIGILTSLFAQRLLISAVYFSAFRRHPAWVLGLTTNRAPWIDALALLAGFAAAILYALAEGLPILRVLDCIAPAAALAFVLNRIGAFLAGIDYGVPTANAWSVTYNSLLAAIWYRTPLGVRLYPVQLYEALTSLILFILLWWWLPRSRQDGELWGTWVFLYGVAAYFLAFYRTPGQSQSQWALRQPVAVVMVVASILFLLRRKSDKYTGKDDSSHI
jgi:phosphatidylglycerol:prolipoprotein diacylglycerol transferase